MRIENFEITADPRNFIVSTMGLVADEKSVNYGKETVKRTAYLASAKSVATHIMDELMIEQINRGIIDIELAISDLLDNIDAPIIEKLGNTPPPPPMD